MAENLADGKVSISGDLAALRRFVSQIKRELTSLEKGNYDVTLEAEDKVTGEVKKVTRKVDDLTRKKGRPKLEAEDKVTGPLARVGGALKRLAAQKTRPKIEAEDQASPVIDRISGSLKRMISGAAIVAGLYAVGRRVKWLGARMISGAADMETYRLTLETVMGSTKAAAEMMDWVVDFAAKTPFEVPGLMESAVRLQAYGIDAREVMTTLGDTAAALGKDVMLAVEALADAQTGEFERLKEFGVKAVEVGKAQLQQFGLAADAMGKTLLLYTDKNGKEAYKIVDRNSRQMVTSNLMAIWNERYAGAMEKQSHAWKGLVSNISDALTMGLTRVGEAILPMLKPYLKNILDYVESPRFSGAFKSIGDGLAAAIPRIASFLGDVLNIARGLWSAFAGPAFAVAKAGFGLLAGTVSLLSRNINTLKPLIVGLVASFAGLRIIQAVSGWVSGLSGLLPKLTGVFSSVGVATARAAGDWRSLGQATSTVTKTTSGLIGTMMPLAGVAIGAGAAIWSAWSAHKAHEAQVKADTLAAAGMTSELEKLRLKTASCEEGTEEYNQALDAQVVKAKEITDQLGGLGAIYDDTGRQIDANTQLINMLASNYDTGNAKLDKFNLSLMQNKATMIEGVEAYESTRKSQEKVQAGYDEIVKRVAEYRAAGKEVPSFIRDMFTQLQSQLDDASKNVATSFQGLRAQVDAFGEKITGPSGLSAMTGKDLKSMLSLLNSTSPQVYKLGMNMMQQIVNAEAQKRPEIAANAQAIMDGVKSRIDELPAGKLTAAKMTEILSQEMSAYGPITAQMQSIIDGVSGKILGWDARGQIQAQMDKISQGISESDAPDRFADLVSSIARHWDNMTLADKQATVAVWVNYAEKTAQRQGRRHSGGPTYYPGSYELLEEEYVMQQSAVRKFGLGFMAAINAGRLPNAPQDNRTIHIHNPIFPGVRNASDADNFMQQVDERFRASSHLRRVLPRRMTP